MNFYVVMQGKTYQQSKEQGVVWCALYDKTGSTPHSWQRMQDVKKGDVLFHCVKGEVVAISQAREDARFGMSDIEEGVAGTLFDALYEELEVAVSVKENFAQIEPLLPVKYSPFQQNGDGNQGFLYPCNEMLALRLLSLISEVNIFTQTDEQLEFTIDPVAHTERNFLAPILLMTEAQAKKQIRDGTRAFAKGLTAIWPTQCAVCGIDVPELLHATYAKPWKDAEGDERTDAHNGLLLCGNHSALYERGYIAFNGSGRIHISQEMDESDYGKQAIHAKMRIAREEEHKKYLKWHKKEVYRG